MTTKQIIDRLNACQDQIVFDEDEHIYMFDGRTMTSVSEFLSPFSSFGMLDPSKLEWPIRKGNIVHATTEFYDGHVYGINTGPLIQTTEEEDEKVQGYIDAYQLFLDEHKPNIIAIEQQVAVKRWGLAGTIDRVAFDEKEQKMTIIDLKTGSKSDANDMQMYIYRKMLKTTTRFRGEVNCILVYLKDDGTYKILEV